MNTEDTLNGFLEHFASLVAAKIQPQQPVELELLEIPDLAKETGLSVTYLKEQCRAYEAGNPTGLRCTRATPGCKNSTLLVGRDWFRAWREKQADLNQDKKLPESLIRQLSK